jgi:hypothetical protein
MTHPPHFSHIFQILDVLMSGRLKSAKKYLAREPNLLPQVDHVMHLFRAYEQATTSTTVRISWQKAGFGFVIRSGSQYLWVEEAKIRGSPDVLELWAIDYSKEYLSARRRQQKCGWLNRGHPHQEFHNLTQRPIPQEQNCTLLCPVRRERHKPMHERAVGRHRGSTRPRKRKM